MNSNRIGEIRLEIERLLMEHERIAKKLGRRVPRFNSRVAKKFGVSRQRVGNIARAMGLTTPREKR
jgi:Zn-dependent peptidase ImmA (M78 family)